MYIYLAFRFGFLFFLSFYFLFFIKHLDINTFIGGGAESIL